jgi:hypothetical protein
VKESTKLNVPFFRVERLFLQRLQRRAQNQLAGAEARQPLFALKRQVQTCQVQMFGFLASSTFGSCETVRTEMDFAANKSKMTSKHQG